MKRAKYEKTTTKAAAQRANIGLNRRQARTAEEPRKRRRPGPCPKGGLPWAVNHSFFDRNVQAVLSRRQDKLGWPISCWEAVEAVTRRHNPEREHGFRPLIQFKSEEEKQRFLRRRWIDFANCYNADPDFVAELFATMTSFHALPPKDWPLPRKLACLSMLVEYEGDDDLPKLPHPLRHICKAEVLKEWFGNDIGPERISVELSRERKRRLDVHAKWNKHYEHLNRQIEAKLTHTPTPKEK